MHKSVMRQLLPLAVVCLLAAQLAAGARITPGRSLLRQLVPDNVTLGRQQFVQATWALQNKTCDEVSAQLNNPFVNNTLAQKVILDFQAELTRQGWPEAAKTVVAVRQPCVTFDINGTKYASYRVLVRFNSTTTTAVKDTMYLGAVSGPCVGGYNKTLYSNVAALFKDFKVSQNNANRQNVWNNGVPNWIEYAAPNMTVCQPKPSPSPSPSPVPVDSPSPSPVASPSPSPSPSPTPDPCPSNATLVNGTCTCNAGLLPSTNGTILISCTAGTTCPAAAPVAIKDQTGVTTGCITTNTPCPASNSLIFYSGSPSVRIECRNNPGGCNVPPFSILVQNTAGAVIGCANVTSNDCPFVAFRNGITTNWALAKCQDVTSCPVFTTGNTDYTVPLLLTNAPNAVPKACVTVPVTSQQTCPSTSSLNFPVEVMFAEPTSPVCGSELSVPPQVCNGNRVIACYAPGVDCVAPYSLRLFTNTTGPTVAECRQLRTVCDLTTTGMGPLNPNANSYTLPTFNGQNVEGCMIAGTTTCPAGYPIPLQGPSGGLAGCQKIGQNLTSCTAGQIPLYNAAGALQSCQPAGSVCPTAFPVTLWDNLIGTRAGCAVSGITQCPVGYSLPTFGAFSSAPNNLTITNCFKDGSVASCTFINVVPGAVQSGAQGTYPTPILSATNATIGCLQSSVPSCPSSAPFPLISYEATPAGGRGTILSCSIVATPCNSTLTPAFTQGTLSACISISGVDATTAEFKCPSDYPVVVINSADPASATTKITMCMSASSTCLDNAPTSSPFTLTTSTTSSPQAFCVPVTGLSSCASYPAGAYQSGVGIYSPNGVSLIGCTDVKTCPAPFFPVFFLDGAVPTPATVRCQASVAGACASVAGGLYPLPITGANGALVGCSALTTSCPTGVAVAENATTSETVTCLASGTTSCPALTYTFPIYSGAVNPNTGGATLVRCIRDPGATNCNGAALGTYNIEVYGPTGTNVIGCVQAAASASATTFCPAGQPVAHMMQGSATPIPFTLAQCRPAGSSCGAVDSGVNFTIPIRNVPQINDAIVGCLASTATTCPGAAGTILPPGAGVSPVFAPFFVLGAAPQGLVECRQVPSGNLPATGTTCAQFLGPSTPYTVATTGTTVSASPSTGLAGCSASGATCPAGFTTLFNSTGGAQPGCVSTSCTGQIILYNAAGVQTGCGTVAATCTALSLSVVIRSGGAALPPQTGCMPAVAACPAFLGNASFAIYMNGNDTTPPTLSECWADANGVQACTGNDAEISTIPGQISNTITGPNPLRGCTPTAATKTLCPTGAPYFIDDDGLLDTNSRCLINPLSSCPQGVPIVDTTNSNSNGPILGCIGAAASLNTLTCPAFVPALPTFTFEIATATAAGAAGAGDVVRCIRSTANCTSPSVPLSSVSAPVGCLINLAEPVCPTTGASGANGANQGNFGFGYYGPTAGSGSSVTDATAKLEYCATPNVASLCSGSYPVSITTQYLTSDTSVSASQKGCMRTTTACPPPYLPIIDTSNIILGCRVTGAVTCPNGYKPLCTPLTGTTTTTNEGVCAAPVGCTAFGTTAVSTNYATTCAAATANKYPVTTGFPIFVVALDGNSLPSTTACYTSAVTTCGATIAPPAAAVYTVRATTNGALSGCTTGGGNADLCKTFWSPNPPKTCAVQTA